MFNASQEVLDLADVSFGMDQVSHSLCDRRMTLREYPIPRETNLDQCAYEQMKSGELKQRQNALLSSRRLSAPSTFRRPPRSTINLHFPYAASDPAQHRDLLALTLRRLLRVLWRGSPKLEAFPR